MSSPLPEVSLWDLHQRLGLSARRLPLNGTIELTFRCNLRCVHCYVNLDCNDGEARRRELPTDRLRLLIDELAEAGTLSLLLTGGEPLLRSDFADLYAHAIRSGLLVTVFTNGTLIGDRLVDVMVGLPPEAVEITLYGSTPATYEGVTRVPGSFDRCIAGIERLRSRNVPLRLKTMALHTNRHEVAAMSAYARDLSVPFRWDGQLTGRIDGAPNQIAAQQLPVEEVRALDRVDLKRLTELQRFCERYARPQSGPSGGRIFRCGAGWGAFAVDPYGRLLPCELVRGDGFDLREARFADGWRDFLPRLRERRVERNHLCPDCNLMSLCANCPGAAEVETGDLEGIVTRFCRIAHSRAAALMGEACGHRADASCCLPPRDRHPSLVA